MKVGLLVPTMAMKELKTSEANFQDMKVELIKDLGDGWTTGLAYTKAWDKDGYYRNYSNGEPDAPISNPIDSTFTVSVKKVF